MLIPARIHGAAERKSTRGWIAKAADSYLASSGAEGKAQEGALPLVPLSVSEKRKFPTETQPALGLELDPSLSGELGAEKEGGQHRRSASPAFTALC